MSLSIVYYSPKRRAIMRRGDDIDPLVVFERDGWMCSLCESPIDPSIRFPDKRAATIDHTVPFACGGTHTWDNVTAAHGYCNEAKGDSLTASLICRRLDSSPTSGHNRQDS